jgi:predicted thioredoxin/glutaredoxin
MKLKNELDILKKHMDEHNDAEFSIQADFIRANFTSQEDEKIINNFIASALENISEKTEKLIREAGSILIREQLKEASEIISMSYIAKKYFNKSRAWLYQKVNGNLKNGKQVKFSPAEIETFNFALQDISKKIGSITIH